MYHEPLSPQINVSEEIPLGNIVYLFFLTKNVTETHHLTTPQDTIDTIIAQVGENSLDVPQDQFISKEKIIFQHDGYPAHYRKNVRDYLVLNYPNRCIGWR